MPLPDRRIAGSPDRRIAGSPCLRPHGATDRPSRLSICVCALEAAPSVRRSLAPACYSRSLAPPASRCPSAGRPPSRRSGTGPGDMHKAAIGEPARPPVREARHVASMAAHGRAVREIESAARARDAERRSLRGSGPCAASLRLKVAVVPGIPGRLNDLQSREPHVRFPVISRNHALSAACGQGRRPVNAARTGLSAGGAVRPQD